MGKSSLVHLIMTGSSIAQPPQTVGCNVAVKVILAYRFLKMNLLRILWIELMYFLSRMQHVTYGSSTGSSNNVRSNFERDFFVELWDISGHERYTDCRSLFYSQVNGR